MTNADIKYTNQRIEILNFLKDNYNHPTVDEVYDGVKNKLSRITKATVYRNLKFLSEKGMIQEVNVKGVSRFEPNIKPHHHIMCNRCKKILDFESKELSEYALKIVKNLKGFSVNNSNTNFYGVCNNCA
ncbi:MAG: transcriptional repressor [Nanoarchaeota archaeon]|nr:transcriptional repressor [Nanoarchaeota archaeon]